MSLSELKKTFEKRKTRLIAILQEADENSMDLSKQHQLYGAIKEIDNFLNILDFYRQKELEEKDSFALKSNRLKKTIFGKQKKEKDDKKGKKEGREDSGARIIIEKEEVVIESDEFPQSLSQMMPKEPQVVLK
ncbi:MAG: hypothetical protein V1659_00510 [Candidatus Woesearchaeota archaeon]